MMEVVAVLSAISKVMVCWTDVNVPCYKVICFVDLFFVE